MKARFKFEVMNALGAILQDEEFKVAYYILNRLALEDTNRTKIYRAMLADLTGKSERSISRITDKLDEKGIIKKDTVSDSKNRYNYYSIHPNIEQSIAQNNAKLGHEEQETTPNLVTDDRFNKKEKNNKNIKNKRNTKEKKQFEIECKNENIETNTEETYENKTLERELEIAIEQNLIPTEEKKKVEVRKQFVQHCDSPIRRKPIPDVEDISQYLKRTRAYAEKTF